MEKGQEQLTIPPSTRTVGARQRHPSRVGVPGVFMPRRVGLSWTLSLVVHGSILVLALWGSGSKGAAPTPTVQLVFVALLLPSPPPLGVPEGKGSAPITETPPQKAENLLPPITAKVKPPKRLVPPKQVVKLKKLKPPPPVAIEPRVSPPAPRPVEEPRTGVATGRVEDGVAGGVTGGTIGGVVSSSLIAAPLRVAQVAHPPVLVSRVEPDYPEIARLREIEGRVVLEAIVDREGQIESKIKVLQSVAVLDNAAITAVKQWRFTPGRNENGQAVRVILEVPIRFMLE